MGKVVVPVLTMAILVVMLVSACGGGEVSAPQQPGPPQAAPIGPAKGGPEAQWQALVAAAKEEGKLTLYTTSNATVINGVAVPFKQKYGIEIESVIGRGEELARRLQSEQTAGIFLADVVIAGGTTGLVTMKPQGLLDPLRPQLVLPEVTDPKVWRPGVVPFVDKDGYSLAMIATAQRYVTRNTDLVKDGEIKSYKDLLDPKWKGKIVSNDPSISGTGSAMYTFLGFDVWGLEPTLDYMRQMIKQEPAFTRDTRLQVEWVARGKYPIGMATLLEQTQEFIRLGSPISQLKVIEGVKLGSGAGGLHIAHKRPHPNATQVFVNWLLTKEGQAAFVKGFGNPSARIDGPTEGIAPDLFAAPDEKVYPDTEEGTLARAVMMEHAKNIFGPLLK